MTKRPEDFDHQIVSTESDECKCGSFHHEGDALWGGEVAPDKMKTDTFGVVERAHSVDVEYRNP